MLDYLTHSLSNPRKITTIETRYLWCSVHRPFSTLGILSLPLLGVNKSLTSYSGSLAPAGARMVHRAVKFTPEILLSAPRRSAGVPNPSGTQILYTASKYSFQQHKKTTEFRVLNVQTGESAELAHDEEISDLNWLNDDRFVCLQSQKNGKTAVHVGSVSKILAQAPEGYELAGTVDAGASNLKITPLDALGESYAVVFSAQASEDGSLFTSEQAKRTLHSSGRLYDSLFVRHWDRYETKEKNALWYSKLSLEGGKYVLSALRNALKGSGLESPILPFGGNNNFDVRHDATIFVAKNPDTNPALSTKCGVYVAFLDFRAQATQPHVQRIVVPGYEGASTSPVFEKNGNKAAFLAMSKAGYEADRNIIFVVPEVRKKQEVIAMQLEVVMAESTAQWDRSPGAIKFAHDGMSILVSAEEYGCGKLFSIQNILGGPQAVRATALTSSGYVSDFAPLASGRVFVTGASLVDNSFYYVVDPVKSPSDLTIWSHSNSSHGGKFGLQPEQVSGIWTPANNPSINKEVHSIVMRPKVFDKNKKYPVAYLIHGGPQSSWSDNWSTRWNPAVFAEQGYIVIAPNPTGSTGYGQAFTDAIQNNWGGDPYEDIVKVFEWVSNNMPEADNNNAVALGASYGGYMMNWIQGHDLGRRFKALVCHDGVFSLPGQIATDELYFPFHDFGGVPWQKSGSIANTRYDVAAQAEKAFGSSTTSAWLKWDPSEHLNNWATPELVIHSEKDYRLTMAEGLAAFNVLQSRGVDSQFLTFSDENHWVLKPENSLVWHKVVLNWINKYTGLPAYSEQLPSDDEFWGGLRSEEEGEAADKPSQGKLET
nr:putative dipeptidyl-peptidase 5 [Quercus suber]